MGWIGLQQLGGPDTGRGSVPSAHVPSMTSLRDKAQNPETPQHGCTS